jgi:hypothetical protein
MLGERKYSPRLPACLNYRSTLGCVAVAAAPTLYIRSTRCQGNKRGRPEFAQINIFVRWFEAEYISPSAQVSRRELSLCRARVPMRFDVLICRKIMLPCDACGKYLPICARSASLRNFDSGRSSFGMVVSLLSFTITAEFSPSILIKRHL